MSGLPDARSDRLRAEAQIAAVLAAHPGLSFLDFQRRGRQDAACRPEQIEGFRWARLFLTLGCRRLESWRSRKSTLSDHLAAAAEEAARATLDRRIDVSPATLVMAALSLGLAVEREAGGPGARVAVRVVWEAGR